MVPALAVAGALRAEGAEVEFVGGSRSEASLVPQAGYEFHPLPVERLNRDSPLHAARSLARQPRAVAAAHHLLGRLRPHAVMGGGGYVAGPVGLAAVSRRLPLVLTEADSHLGLTNRALAPFARRVCLAFPPSVGERRRLGRRYVVTGRPIPEVTRDRTAGRARFGVQPGEVCVLVFGGSLGARSLNYAALDAFDGSELRVLHVTGSRDYALLSQRVPAHGYDLIEYLGTAEFAAALAAADLVVARAGGSVFEIAASGVPAILVPYPHATADHQSANARWMADAGAAIVIPDAELTPARLALEVGHLIGDRPRMASMARSTMGLARPDAARVVADELLAAARGRSSPPVAAAGE